MQVYFIPSETIKDQGNKSEIYKKYGKNYNISSLGKGGGNWLITKKSDIIVNGKSYRNFVLEYYGEDKLTRKLAERFEKDLENGSIKLDNDNSK